MLRFLHRRLAGRQTLALGFANHNFLLKCQPMRERMWAEPNLLLLNDGIGMEIGCRLRRGRGFRENMNGTDFTPLFLAEEPNELRIYLVGGRPEVVAQAAAQIGAMPRRTVVGFTDGFSLWKREEEVVAEIARLKPDLLLVGLGNPLQERWILDNMARLDATLIFGIGALYEWMTGTKRRAPMLVRRLHLEWIYRLALEPRRLGARYTVDVLRFFALLLTDKSR